MASEIFQRDDLSIYVVAGVPRSFKSTLAGVVDEVSDHTGDVALVKDELAEWFLAKLAEDSRRNHERTPASSALWRAFRALSAARYHLRHGMHEEQVRDLRREIEELWTLVSPLTKGDSDEAVGDSDQAVGD